MEKITARKGSALDAYPEIIEQIYSDIFEKVDKNVQEDLAHLIDLIYGTGYLDGVMDTLVLKGKL